jgi:hypothetical protein
MASRASARDRVERRLGAHGGSVGAASLSGARGGAVAPEFGEATRDLLHRTYERLGADPAWRVEVSYRERLAALRRGGAGLDSSRAPAEAAPGEPRIAGRILGPANMVWMAPWPSAAAAAARLKSPRRSSRSGGSQGMSGRSPSPPRPPWNSVTAKAASPKRERPASDFCSSPVKSRGGAVGRARAGASAGTGASTAVGARAGAGPGTTQRPAPARAPEADDMHARTPSPSRRDVARRQRQQERDATPLSLSDLDGSRASDLLGASSNRLRGSGISAAAPKAASPGASVLKVASDPVSPRRHVSFIDATAELPAPTEAGEDSFDAHNAHDAHDLREPQHALDSPPPSLPPSPRLGPAREPDADDAWVEIVSSFKRGAAIPQDSIARELDRLEGKAELITRSEATLKELERLERAVFEQHKLLVMTWSMPPPR